MYDPKFDLLKTNPQEQGNNPKEQIEKLKDLVRQYTTLQNEWADHIWDIDYQLTQPKISDENKTMLLKEKTNLNKKIQEANYPEKIPSLLSKIKALQIKEYGESEIGDKPFNL